MHHVGNSCAGGWLEHRNVLQAVNDLLKDQQIAADRRGWPRSSAPAIQVERACFRTA
jgi:hypothetical protein